MALINEHDTRLRERLPHNADARTLERGLLVLEVPHCDSIDPCLAGKIILAPLQKCTSRTALSRGHSTEM
jgi:hypothetical protein